MRAKAGKLGGFALLLSAVVIVIVLASVPAPVTLAADRVSGAIALYGAGNQKGCARVLEDLLRSAPGASETWLLAGLLAETRRAVAEAERSYENALARLPSDDPRVADVQVSLADLTRRKGDPARALAAIDKVARERGESIRLRHARVLALVDLRRFDEALSETRVVAEEKLGAGLAKRLEKLIRSSRTAAASRKS
jgi:predicted Zn-dependent protease